LDTITYAGAISVGPTADGSQLVLTGTTAREGIITGGFTQTGTSADVTVNGGTWTLSGTASTVADDLFVSGTSTILNLNSAGVVNFGTSTGNLLQITNGGTVNLGASGTMTGIADTGVYIAQSAGGAEAVLNMNGFNQTFLRLILGERLADRSGLIDGTGTLTIDGTTGIELFRGAINANLASTAATPFNKNGPGTVTLKGDNSGIATTTAAIVNEGTLILDYTANNATKLREASALDMRGATLKIVGNDTANTIQTVASFTLASGGNNVIDMNAGTSPFTATLNLNALTRAASVGTLRLNLNADARTIVTTDNLNLTTGIGVAVEDRILGGWLTVTGSTGTFFARNVPNTTDGSIGAANTTLHNAVGSWALGQNISDTGSGFTGTLTGASINSLRFNAAAGTAVSMPQSGVLSLASGGILVTDQVASGSPGILGGTLVTGVIEIIITQDSAASFEIGADIRINNAVTKSGFGTLILSGDNVYTGQTQIQNGTLVLSGGNAIGNTSLVTLAGNRNSTIQLDASETIGRLAGGRRNDNSDYGTVAIGTHTLTLNHAGGNTTYAGRFTGTGNLIMSNSSVTNLQITGVSSGFTGGLEVNGGLLQMTTAGRIDASSITINNAGMLMIDNNGTTSSTSRILDTTPITLNSAVGTATNPRGLWVRNGDNDSSRFETIGNLVFNSGTSYLTGEAQVGTGNARAGIIANDFVRNNSATISVRGRNLGTTLTHHNQFRIGTAGNQTAFIVGLTGGAGAAASATISIVPWAIGETHNNTTNGATNMGNSLVTYVSGTGFRPLDLSSEYAGYGAAGTTNNTRESLTTDLTGLTGRTLNSLVIHNNNTAASGINVTGSGAGQTLTNTSGAFLFTLNPTAAASSAHTVNLGGFDDGIAVGGSEYLFYVVNPSAAATTATLTTTISSNLVTSADLTKSGRGTLILTGTNPAGGGGNKTTLNEGTLEIADLDNIGGNTGGLVFAGGTLRLGTGFTDDISSRSISFLLGGGTLDTNGIDLTLANSLGSGVGGFTKAGLGNLTLSGTATYTGNSALTLGTVTVGANNALGNGGNLTLAANTTLALGNNSLSHGLVTTSGASPNITGTGTLTASTGFLLNHTGNTAIEAVLAGAGGILKAQTNIVTLSGLNTYTGTTEVQAGSLSFNSIANVGGGASALGAPTTVETGIIRLGLTTVAVGLTYTGVGHSTDRIIELQGTTGVPTIHANGSGALALGVIQTSTPGNKTLTLRGTSDPLLVNSTGAIKEVGGVLTLNKTDANTWMVNAASSYTGVTQIDNGALLVGVTNALPITTTVRLGTGATAGTLDLNGFDQTIGSLLVQTTNNAVTNNVIVDATNTLTINGAVTIGVNANESDTNLSATGGGAIVVNSTNANFQIGAGTGDNENRVDVDFTGLASFTANLGTGTFRLGDANTGVGNSTSTFKLAVDNTITAASIRIGDGTGGSNTHTLTLGSGSNLLNANTINIGSAGTTIRSGGAVVFDDADTTGTLTVRASDGTTRAVLNMINTTGNTAADMLSTLDLAGHTADILASTVTMASRTTGTGAATATLTFDQGTLDVTTLNLASRTGAGTGNATATVHFGDSAAPGTPTVTIGTINMGVNTSAGGAVLADLNITGGDFTIGTGSGTAINMANAGTGRTVTSNLNLTGGTVGVTGNIIRQGGAGIENATITLNGSAFNLNGNSLGTAAATIAFNAHFGSLSGLGELNGGSILDKTTAGVLSLGNGNTYTGGTTVSAGTLLANNTTGSATGSGAVAVLSGASLGGSGIIAPATDQSVTIHSGATLTVGNSTDIQGSDLTISTSGTGTLTITGKVEFDIWSGAGGGNNTADPLSADRLIIGDRPVILGGTLAINNPNSIMNWTEGDIWRLFDWALATSVSGSFTNITSTVGNFNDLPDLSDDLLGWDTTNLYTHGTLSVVVIPEPSRALLVLIGLLGAVMRRRK